MRVLVIKPGQAPTTQDIDNTLEDLQELVNVQGRKYIEVFYPFNDSVACICNEEGKLYPCFEPNRAILNDYGQVQDIVFGTLIITGISEVDGDLTSLTEKQIEQYSHQFHYANEFYIDPSGTLCYENVDPNTMDPEQDIEIGEE